MQCEICLNSMEVPYGILYNGHEIYVCEKCFMKRYREAIEDD